MQTFVDLAAPVKKKNCLNEMGYYLDVFYKYFLCFMLEILSSKKKIRFKIALITLLILLLTVPRFSAK